MNLKCVKFGLFNFFLFRKVFPFDDAMKSVIGDFTKGKRKSPFVSEEHQIPILPSFRNHDLSHTKTVKMCSHLSQPP